jgi:hypothetical protein
MMANCWPQPYRVAANCRDSLPCGKVSTFQPRPLTGVVPANSAHKYLTASLCVLMFQTHQLSLGTNELRRGVVVRLDTTLKSKLQNLCICNNVKLMFVNLYYVFNMFNNVWLYVSRFGYLASDTFSVLFRFDVLLLYYRAALTGCQRCCSSSLMFDSVCVS